MSAALMMEMRPSAWAYDINNPSMQTRCPFRKFEGYTDATGNNQYGWQLAAPFETIGQLYTVSGAATSTDSADSIQFLVSEGRMAPLPSFWAVDQDDLSLAMGLATFSDVVPYTSNQNIIVFDQAPPASQTLGGGAPSALLRSLYIDPPAFVMAGSDRLDFCAASGIAPDGTIWVEPSDIGNGADQIPASVTNNTAAQFQAHPSVFIPAGSSRYIRSVQRTAIDVLEINAPTSGQPFRLRSVTSEPALSDWLVGVDGAETILRVYHPSGSDYRRPKDIWNNVIVPLIQGSQIGSTMGASENDALASIANLKYSHYWRCLSVDGDGSGLTDITQTDTTPPV